MLIAGQDGNFKGGSMLLSISFRCQHLKCSISLTQGLVTSLPTAHSYMYLNWGSSGDVDILCPVCLPPSLVVPICLQLL